MGPTRCLASALLVGIGARAGEGVAQSTEATSRPPAGLEAAPGFLQLRAGENLVEPDGVAVNSEGLVYVFHRGRHPSWSLT
jgi:hypothetical protein